MSFVLLVLWLLGAPLGALLSAAPACDAAAWERAYVNVLSAHPRAQASDLYKLAQQGIRGSEHAVGDRAGAAAWMTRELGELDTLPATIEEPTIEPLPPDGRFVRVHLRPFLKSGGNPERLVDAFVATANAPASDTAEFACAERGAAAAMLARGGSGAVTALFAERRAAGFDATHHSAEYAAAYRPAYRVVARKYVAGLMRAGTRGSRRTD